MDNCPYGLICANVQVKCPECRRLCADGPKDFYKDPAGSWPSGRDAAAEDESPYSERR